MIRIGIVIADFNSEITSVMEKEAVKEAERLGTKIAANANVPGVYDMPLAVSTLLERKDIDGVVTIGAVIKGETRHDEVIVSSIAHAFIELSLKHKKPVGLGIIGPGVSWEKAKERANEYAKRSVRSVVSVAKVLKSRK